MINNQRLLYWSIFTSGVCTITTSLSTVSTTYCISCLIVSCLHPHRLFSLRTRDWKWNHVSQWFLYITSKQSALERTLKLPPMANLKVLNF